LWGGNGEREKTVMGRRGGKGKGRGGGGGGGGGSRREVECKNVDLAGREIYVSNVLPH